jgi:hypothetical protein
MRDAALLAARFFKELADIFDSNDGHGKYSLLFLVFPQHAQISLGAKNLPRQKWPGETFSKESYKLSRRIKFNLI